VNILSPTLFIITVSLPPADFVPDHEPEAIQEFELVEDHVNVTEVPMVTLVLKGPVNVIEGIGFTELLPPPPPPQETTNKIIKNRDNDLFISMF